MTLSKWSWMTLGLGAVGLLGCGGADTDSSFAENETMEESAAATAAPKSFLSLGNSIAFGFNPLVTTPNIPSSYIGYPEVIKSRGNKVTNASCPGETSSSFLSADPVTAPDNGCRAFKAAYSLHADYETTQIAFTVAAVKKARFDFVTLDLGANDLFLLQKGCNGDLTCIQTGLPGVIQKYSQNLYAGYNQVKPYAQPTTKFIALTTYATNYADPLQVGALTQLNAALVAFANNIGGRVADGFAEFQSKSAAYGGDACAAGLLIKLPDGTCDIHPSEKGRGYLADRVMGQTGK